MANTEIENPAASRLVAESWQLWGEAFRMARQILKENEPSEHLHDAEQRATYYAAIPSMASRLHDEILSNMAFLHNTKEQEQITRYEEAVAMVRALRVATLAREAKES